MEFKLIPAFAIFRNLSIISRSFWYSPLIFMLRRFFDLECRSRSRLMKWWISGIARPRCTRRPMLVSSTLAVTVPSLSICSMAAAQATSLLSGSLIRRRRKSISHPRIVFVSWRRASAVSLLMASIVSRGIGSFKSSGRARVLVPSSGPRSHQTRLSVPSTSTVSETISSI